MARIYFDNAATTPIDPSVTEEMSRIMTTVYGNPSSIHHEGRMAKTVVEKSRKNIANLLKVAPAEIFFTGGGTEADNMAIAGCVNDLGVTQIITSAIEHHAVLHTAELFQNKGIEVSYVNLTANGHVDLSHLETLLADKSKGKTLVSLMHANNEIGNILDLETTGAICAAHGAYFHCDTVQTVGHLPIDIKKSGIHFLSASAHKFNGPKGVGFIFIDEKIRLQPMIHGGSQERNMRGGTENTYGIAGLAKALEIAYQEMELQEQRIKEIKLYMMNTLMENVPGVAFNGDYNGRSLFTVLNVAFPVSDFTDMVLFNLDIEGVSASGGSACSSGSNQGSHVLSALEVGDQYTSVRFSFGKYNTKEEVDTVVKKILELKQQTVNSQQSTVNSK